MLQSTSSELLWLLQLLQLPLTDAHMLEIHHSPKQNLLCLGEILRVLPALWYLMLWERDCQDLFYFIFPYFTSDVCNSAVLLLQFCFPPFLSWICCIKIVFKYLFSNNCRWVYSELWQCFSFICIFFHLCCLPAFMDVSTVIVLTCPFIGNRKPFKTEKFCSWTID